MAKNCQLILLRLLFVLSLLLSPAASQAGDVTPQIAFARDGNSVIATVYARIPDGYHAYAHTPGDAGRPTTLDFFLADPSQSITRKAPCSGTTMIPRRRLTSMTAS